MLAVIHGDILDVEADGLVSSGNIQLNMSGGVNGALLARYGASLQKELHGVLKQEGLRFVEPGFIHHFNTPIGAYKAVTYCVGVNVWYESSPELIEDLFERSFAIMHQHGCRTVATCAIGTGFGKLSKEAFAKALSVVVKRWEGVLDVFLVERSRLDAQRMQSFFDGLLKEGSG